MTELGKKKFFFGGIFGEKPFFFNGIGEFFLFFRKNKSMLQIGAIYFSELDYLFALDDSQNVQRMCKIGGLSQTTQNLHRSTLLSIIMSVDYMMLPVSTSAEVVPASESTNLF